MADNERSVRTGLIWLTGLLTLLSAGCFSHQSPGKVANSQRVEWPSPPEPARIQYLYTFRTPQDLAIKRGILSWLTGDTKQYELLQPAAIAVGGNDAIYVLDLAGAINLFDVGSKKFRQQRETLSNQLKSPVSLTLGVNDSVYVVDAGINKVIVYDRALRPVREFSTGFVRTAGISFDRWKKWLWIVDAKANRVVAFTLDGKRVSEIGADSALQTSLNTPTHIALDSSGLYVTDAYNFQIRKYARDGKLLNSFGKLGTNTGSFSRPKGVAVDSDQNVYVVDALFGNVQLFNQKSELLLFFGTTGQVGPGSLNLPSGISIDQRDRIYVADTHHGAVQVFQYLKQQARTK